MATVSAVSMDIKKMHQLVENLKRRAVISVGVFQDKTARKEKGLTNAMLAQYHELGVPEHNLPARSMLKVPIGDHAQEIMSDFKGKADAFLVHSKLISLYKLIGIKCEKIVLGAFDTGGYGKWAPLKYGTLLGKFKGNLKTRKGKLAQIYGGQIGEAILIRTGALRRAFSSRVRMTF